MKVCIYDEEWYPVFMSQNISEEGDDSEVWGICVEVPQEVVEKWDKVFEEFDKVQKEMKEYLRREEEKG